jgi:hypothetical protein
MKKNISSLIKTKNMGYYINELPTGEVLPNFGKAGKLLTVEGVKKIEEPNSWEEDIVCVVENRGMFEAAGYCFNEQELSAFKYPDGRRKTWLKVPNAKELAK